MNINTNTIISISQANQNFSKVANLVDQYGCAVIMKNNSPQYIVYQFSQVDNMQLASEQEIENSSNKLIKKNKNIYKELAK